MVAHVEYVKCPYCNTGTMAQGKKRPLWYRAFEVKLTSRNVMVFTCLKCKGRFYARLAGVFLTAVDMKWHDMEVDKFDKEVEAMERESEVDSGSEKVDEELGAG